MILRRGDRGDEVKALQELLIKGGRKLKADGILGPITLREAHHLLGLDPDGEISDKEIDAIEAIVAQKQAPPSEIERVWIFNDFSLPSPSRQASWVKEIVELQVTDVVFGLNTETDAKFYRTLGLDRIESCTEDLDDLGVSVHFMSWLRPDERFQVEAQDELLFLCHRVQPASILFDVEHFWIKPFAREPKAVETFTSLFQKWPCPLGVTSYAALPSAVAPLLPLVDYGLPQAYSVWTEKAWTQQPNVQPGPMQELAARTWASAKRLIMGLANYSQARPGMTQREAMLRALEATKKAGVKEVAYWSKKNIAGSSAATRERAEIVRRVREG